MGALTNQSLLITGEKAEVKALFSISALIDGCGDKKNRSQRLLRVPARIGTMGAGSMKSPTPAFYGDVPSLSLPVDWTMPNEDICRDRVEIVWLHTSSLQYTFIILELEV